MAIFYMKTNIIGRSSGRSSVGAAAYRAGEKLRSVAHASYQSGEKLQGKDSKNGKITHDYRAKGGVVHKEIMLPENAPPEFADRETLWNAVEASETRKNSQLAREIIAALPREFSLHEQIEVMRKYVHENFVEKGMVADFSLHDTSENNPHAHIMLTTRHVTLDGFGGKNRDWNKKEFLLSYREAWTHIINSTFEHKGMDERIDHRSYKEQGIDRLPYIHLGHEAAALEKKGIHTKRGDYNREIKRRNEERAQKEAELMELQEAITQGIKEATTQIITALQQQQKITMTAEHIEESSGNGTTSESVPNEVRTTLTTASRMSEPQDTYVPHDEKPLTPKENHLQKPTVIEMAKHSGKLRQKKNSTYLNLKTTKSLRNMLESENFYMNLEIEEMDEQAQNVQTLLNRVPQLESELQRQHFWNWRQKKKLDKEIEQAEKDGKVALLLFEKNRHVSPDEISRPISQIKKKIAANKLKIADIDGEIVKITKKLAAAQQEYDRYKLEFKIKVRRLLKKQPAPLAESAQTTDRQSVRERLQTLNSPRKERRQHEAVMETLRTIKPKKFLMIASPEQKKRSLSDVLGKYYRKINGQVYPSVPPAKNRKI